MIASACRSIQHATSAGVVSVGKSLLSDHNDMLCNIVVVLSQSCLRRWW